MLSMVKLFRKKLVCRAKWLIGGMFCYAKVIDLCILYTVYRGLC